MLYAMTKNKIFHKVLAFILIVFSGIRYDVGTDYQSYTAIFNNVKSLGRYYGIEWGYYYLMELVEWFGGTQQLVFFIMAAVTIIFIYKYIDELSVNANLSWLLYLCIGPYYLAALTVLDKSLYCYIAYSKVC